MAGAVIACVVLLAAPVAVGGVAYGVEDVDEKVVCVGDSCQPLPVEPEDPTPGTLVPNPGNPPLRFHEPKGKPKHHGRHRKRHHGDRSGHGNGRKGESTRR
jgi:hypothetical protein